MEKPDIPQIPNAFALRMKEQLGPDYVAFEDSLDAQPPVSIRLHPQRSANLFSNSDRISWHSAGRYLPKRPIFTLDPNFHAGAYYVQEASSMLLAPAVNQLLPTERPWRILDLCGAPGGKSTLLSEMAPPGSILVSNEVIAARSSILRHNIQKWGFGNTVVTQADPEGFADLKGFFDLIIVDAPCSGEGLFRKDPQARSVWNPELVTFCASRQRRILRAAVPLLAEGGCMVYSTCTLNQEENEENAKWLVEEMGLDNEKLNFPGDWNFQKAEYGYYALQHLVRGEGFYLAAFRQSKEVQSYPGKNESLPKGWRRIGKKKSLELKSWVDHPEDHLLFGNEQGVLRFLQQTDESNILPLFRIKGKIWIGTEVGQHKGPQFIPAQGLALSLFRSSAVPTIDLDRPRALQYLKGDALQPDQSWSRGWQLFTYEGRGLGWAKVLDKRVNNYFPKSDRIRMAIPK